MQNFGNAIFHTFLIRPKTQLKKALLCDDDCIKPRSAFLHTCNIILDANRANGAEIWALKSYFAFCFFSDLIIPEVLKVAKSSDNC